MNSSNLRRYLFRLVPIGIAALVVLFQFSSAERFTNAAGRKARVALSKDQETALGLQSYRQVLSQSRVIDSGPQYELVASVADRLSKVTGDDGRDFQWSVAVVASRDINAFCLPGGKIVTYTGILPVAEDENGLATVMGHEMAHATLRHGSERLLKQKATQTMLTGVQFSLGDMSYEQRRAVMGAIGAGAQYGILYPFSRDHESEADKIGLFYMARAGFDPREAVSFWERMSRAGSGEKPPEFMSTHPSDQTRIAQLKALLPQAMDIYNKRIER